MSEEEIASIAGIAGKDKSRERERERETLFLKSLT
jgi:hypothetical protein